MSSESVERMKAAFAALEGGDVSGVLAYLHEDFEVRDQAEQVAGR